MVWLLTAAMDKANMPKTAAADSAQKRKLPNFFMGIKSANPIITAYTILQGPNRAIKIPKAATSRFLTWGRTKAR